MRWLLEYPSAQALSWRCMVIPSWSLMWTRLAVWEWYIRRCWYCCRSPRNWNWGKDVIQFDEDVDEVVPMRSTCLPPAGANPHFLYDHLHLKLLQWRRYMRWDLHLCGSLFFTFFFLFLLPHSVHHHPLPRPLHAPPSTLYMSLVLTIDVGFIDDTYLRVNLLSCFIADRISDRWYTKTYSLFPIIFLGVLFGISLNFE
jgi:hypothetical protein